MINQSFNEALKTQIPALEKFVPIVERVHGEHHPEFYDVRKVFNTVLEKIKEAGTDRPELKEEFTKLREITNNYKVPDDVCETYEAVYKMLHVVDNAYQG